MGPESVRTNKGHILNSKTFFVIAEHYMYFRIGSTNLDNVGKLVHVQLGGHEEENGFSGDHQLRMCAGFVSLDEAVNPEHFSHAKECQVAVVLSVLGCLGFPFLQL